MKTLRLIESKLEIATQFTSLVNSNARA